MFIPTEIIFRIVRVSDLFTLLSFRLAGKLTKGCVDEIQFLSRGMLGSYLELMPIAHKSTDTLEDVKERNKSILDRKLKSLSLICPALKLIDVHLSVCPMLDIDQVNSIFIVLGVKPWITTPGQLPIYAYGEEEIIKDRYEPLFHQSYKIRGTIDVKVIQGLDQPTMDFIDLVFFRLNHPMYKRSNGGVVLKYPSAKLSNFQDFKIRLCQDEKKPVTVCKIKNDVMTIPHYLYLFSYIDSLHGEKNYHIKVKYNSLYFPGSKIIRAFQGKKGEEVVEMIAEIVIDGFCSVLSKPPAYLMDIGRLKIKSLKMSKGAIFNPDYSHPSLKRYM